MLIGRKREIRRLQKVFASSEAEFVVLYGRRRIGKTYLIRQFFLKQDCDFVQATGLQNGSLSKQLAHFIGALSDTYTQGIPLQLPASWEEAFQMLRNFINRANGNKKTVIFLDELPWMATRRSGLLETLDYYWNHYWSSDPNIILIVCGSSASWLINKIIYNKGGLYNRCTCEIKLNPFDLGETFEYLNSRGVKLNQRQVLALYMAFGGIPYYLKFIESGLTAAQNIQHLFFDKVAPLQDEFDKLFESLFTNPLDYIELVKVIAKKKDGISRADIEKQFSPPYQGGRLTERLSHLVQTNFISVHLSFEKQRGEYYKLTDEFCLFHLTWVQDKRGEQFANDYWLQQCQKSSYHVWSGYAFEAICRKHIDQLLKAFQIKTAENLSSWRFVPKASSMQKGAQIDLLINRGDDAITLCEIKYTDKPFCIDKAYAENLKNKIQTFVEKTKTKKQIFLTIISASGLVKNQYADALVDGIATLADLFINAE